MSIISSTNLQRDLTNFEKETKLLTPSKQLLEHNHRTLNESMLP